MMSMGREVRIEKPLMDSRTGQEQDVTRKM